MEEFWENIFLQRISHNVVLDLGTASTSLLCESLSLKINEPSFTAYNMKKRELVAVGAEAKAMLGRTPPEIVVLRPIKNGAIVNFEMATAFIEYLLKKCKAHGLFKPKVMLTYPTNSSGVVKRGLQETLRVAGAGSVYLIEKVIASAIGAEIHVMEPYGGMIVDFGASYCRVAIVSLGGIVMYRETPIAGDSMTEAVASMLRSKFNLITGDNSAEELKINLGTAVFADQEMEMVVKGRDLITGLPTAVTVDTKSMHQALAEPLKNALEQIKSCIELAPHELIGDIINNGVIISGGVASLRGIDQYFSEALNIKCSIAPEPSYSSVLGMNRLLSDLHLMKHFFASNRDRISELE